MKALKALVIFMGVLLAGGVVLLVYGFATKLPSRGGTAAPARGSAPAELTLPPGARIEQMVAVGNRVVLHVSGGGTDQLIMLDPATGTVAGTVVVKGK